MELTLAWNKSDKGVENEDATGKAQDECDDEIPLINPIESMRTMMKRGHIGIVRVIVDDWPNLKCLATTMEAALRG